MSWWLELLIGGGAVVVYVLAIFLSSILVDWVFDKLERRR